MAHGLLKTSRNALAGKSECGKTGIGSRRIFPPHFKLQVLDSYRNDADCKGNQRATARKYGIHRRQIQKWLQAENNLRNSVGKKCEISVIPEAKVALNGRQRDDSILFCQDARVPALSPVAYVEETQCPLDFTTHSRTYDPTIPIDLSVRRPVRPPSPRAEPPTPSKSPFTCLISSPQPDVWDLSIKPKKRKFEEALCSPNSTTSSHKPVKLFKPYLDDVNDSSSSCSSSDDNTNKSVDGKSTYELMKSPCENRTCCERAYEITKSSYENTRNSYEHTKSLYENARTAYENAKNRYESSYENLKSYEKSKSPYENIKASYENAKNAFENAQSRFENTKSPLEKSRFENAKSPIEKKYDIKYEMSKSPYDMSKSPYETSKSSYDTPKSPYDMSKSYEKASLDVKNSFETSTKESAMTVVENNCPSVIYHNHHLDIFNNNNNNVYANGYTIHELQPTKATMNYYFHAIPNKLYSADSNEISSTHFCAYEDNFEPPLKQRQSYSLDFKLSAIECYYQDEYCRGNQRAVANKYNIHRRQVQKWLKQEEELRQRNESVKQMHVFG